MSTVASLVPLENTADDPQDAALIALGERFAAAAARGFETEAKWKPLYDRSWQIADKPEAIYPRESDRAILRDCGLTWPIEEGHYTAEHYVALKKRLKFIDDNRLKIPQLLERYREICEGVLQYERAQAAAAQQLGVPVLEAQEQAAHDLAVGIGLQILRAPAHSIAGLAVKARCHQWCIEAGYDTLMHRDFNEQEVIKSVLRDLLGAEPKMRPAWRAAEQ